MAPNGVFTVGDDDDDVIATALSVATTAAYAPQIAGALAPGGSGLHVQAFGGIYRLESRDELPHPYDQDPALDPETQELWALYREWTRSHGPKKVVMAGDELRELVGRALELRRRAGLTA